MDETEAILDLTAGSMLEPAPAAGPVSEPETVAMADSAPEPEPVVEEVGPEAAQVAPIAAGPDLAPITVAPATQVRRWTWATGLLAAVLVLFVVGSAAAVVGDWLTLPMVPNGVTLAGATVGGLAEAALRARIDEGVSKPAMQPLTVYGDSKTWMLDPQGIVTIDTDAMVREAYAPAARANLVTRLYSRVTGAPLATVAVKPAYNVDRTALAAWVERTAGTVDRSPVDATRSIVAYQIKITPEVPGAKVDRARAVEVLSAALTADAQTQSARTAELPIAVTKPKTLAASFSRAIVVSIARCKVYLFDGATLVKTYSCAPGQPAWPTPLGDFHIVRKQANAPWINPHSAWSLKMPETIPGGPYNPMGDRKLALDYPGIYLHGIPPSEFGSIGTHASHGCMRMMPSAIHDLYPRVKVGDPVFIRP